MPKHRKNKNLQICNKPKNFPSLTPDKSIQEEDFGEKPWLFGDGKKQCIQTTCANQSSAHAVWKKKKTRTNLRKTVSFSDPLVFESSKELATYYHELKKSVNKAVPRKPISPENGNIPKWDSNVDKNLNEFAKWKSKCTRWVARIEDMIEMEQNAVKHLSSEGRETNVIRFCDNQRHLYLGNGPDFTSVYIGVTSAGKEVAVKKINVKRAPALHNVELVQGVLSLSPHPNLLMTRFIIRDKSHFYVVRDLADYTLKEQLSKRKFISEGSETPWNPVWLCSEIAKAINHLHSNGILHMAIKPENIMVSSDGEVAYTCEYGIHDRITSKSAKQGSNTRCWLATEILKLEEGKVGSAGHTKESDIASLGMLFYHIITAGGHPYGDHENAPGNCVKTIMHGSYNLKALDDPFAHHLVKNMIFKEPEKRFTISQVTEHPYFWSQDCRNEYAKLLMQCFVTVTDMCLSIEGNAIAEYNDLIDCVKTRGSDILGTYMKDSNKISKKKCSDLYSLFSYLIANQDDPLSANFEEAIESSNQASWTLFPGILLFTYADLGLARLRQISNSLEAVVPMNKKPSTVHSPYSIDSGLESPDTMEEAFASLYMEERVTSCTIPVPSRKEYDVFDDHDLRNSFQEDDGIDVLTPLSGNLIDGNPFFPGERTSSSPIQCKDAGMRPEVAVEQRALSPGSYGSTVDNFFEFDKGDYVHDLAVESSEAAYQRSVQRNAAAKWTDIDELD